MPIVLARVDNRLLHGQILASWVPATGAEGLLVLDDEAAADTLARSAMEIAVPSEVRLEVAPVADAAQAAARFDPRAPVIVLVREVADALRAVQAGLRPAGINIGNLHFGKGRVPVSHSVYLAAPDLDVLGRIEGLGVPVELRTLPRDAPVGLPELRRRVAAAGGAGAP